jgi:response regulator NasT
MRVIAVSSLRVILLEPEAARSSNTVDLLEGAGCKLVSRAPDTEVLCDCLQRMPVDLVALSVDTPDEALFNGLLRVQAVSPIPVVLFTADDAQDTIRRAVQSGVSAYVADGVNPSRVRSILDAAMARFQQFKALADELVRTRGQLAERKQIERAKGIIMAQRGLSEEQAYRLMRKTAMDRNKRMAEIADSIIAASELLSERPSAPPTLAPVGVG